MSCEPTHQPMPALAQAWREGKMPAEPAFDEVVELASAYTQLVAERKPGGMLPPIHDSNGWLKRLWPIVNRRRGELIDRKVLGKATEEEIQELDLLQNFADAYLAPYDEVRVGGLQALVEEVEQRVDLRRQNPSHAPADKTEG